MLDERFKKIQDEFVHLQGMLAAGRISKSQFTTALQELMIEYEGRYWTIGGNSGKWYVHDGHNWLEAEPPTVPEVLAETPAPPPVRPTTQPARVHLREHRILEGHNDKIECIALTPDGRSILSGGMEGSIILWRTEGAKPPRTLVEGDSVFKHVLAAAFSEEGTYAVAASKDGFVRVWESQTGRMVRRITGCREGAFAAAFAPGERYVFAGCGDGTIRHCDMQTSAVVRVLEGHAGEIAALAVSPTGNRLVSLADDQTLRLWDIATGEEVAQIALGAEYGDKLARGIVFRPRTNHLLTYSLGMSIDLWDLDTLAKIRRYECGWGVSYGVAFSPDGETLFVASGTDYLEEKDRAAIGGSDNVIRIMDVETGSELGRVEGHKNDVTCLAVSRSGKLLASASEDKTIRIWHIE